MRLIGRFIRKLVTGVCLLLLTAALVGGSYYIYQGYRMYQTAITEEGLEQRIAQVRDKTNYTTAEEMPQIYLDAVVAVEDSRFFTHGGIDVISISRAVVTNIKAGELVEGGSTITQQLAKNILFNQDKDFVRKAAEVFAAIDIEKNYSKMEILELYLNSIYFGSGYYCVYDAGMGYFGKVPMDMNDYESTLLAGIPNAPSVYSLTNSPELAGRRQEIVVERLVELEIITKERGEEILSMQAVLLHGSA